MPCLNSGVCQSKDGINYACECPPRFSGSNCELPRDHPEPSLMYDPCFSQPCFNGGQCHRRGSKFECACQRGFQGVHCEADLRSQVHTALKKLPSSKDGAMEFASLLSVPSLTTKTLTAEKILDEFKALNDPQKILAYSQKLSQLKVINRVEEAGEKSLSLTVDGAEMGNGSF